MIKATDTIQPPFSYQKKYFIHLSLPIYVYFFYTNDQFDPLKIKYLKHVIILKGGVRQGEKK